MSEVVVARKIAEIRARVARVRELLPASASDFQAVRTDAEALILNLYLALQGCSDLAMHVVADRGLGVPADARGAFELLERAGVLEPGLTRNLMAAVGLRNRIAHQYGSLDLQRVYDVAKGDLGDVEALSAAVAAAYRLDSAEGS